MRLWTRLRHVYRNAFHRRRLETDLDDELRNYVHELIARKTAAGMSATEARRSALAEVGGIEQVKEASRDVRPLAVLESVIRDLGYAARTLRKSPAFTATAVLSLALGIGATSALFSGVNGLLLRTVPVSHPETLVRIRSAGRNDVADGVMSYGLNGQNASGEDIRETISYPIYQALRSANRTLTDIAATAPISPIGDITVMVDGRAELVSASEVSGNYFALLGVGAQLGRPLMPDDDTDPKSAVAAISYGYWQRRFGASPATIGRSIAINNVRITVVGILPGDFADIQSLTTPPRDIYIPLALDSRLGLLGMGAQSKSRMNEGANWWLQLVGRLKPGVTLDQVRGNLEGPFEDAARRGWQSQVALVPRAMRLVLDRTADNEKRTAVPHLEMDSASRGIYDPRTDDVKAARILGVVVALMMVIVCANVANLLLSRAAARQREVSVRMSLGATRLRVVRQLLTESLLLSWAGCVSGVMLGYGARQLLPFAKEAPMDWRVLTFTLVVSLIAAVSFGLAPALHATRLDLSGRMKESGRSVTRPRTLVTRALVVVQVAISLAVLIGAGLFLRTVRNLRKAPPGFDTRNLIVFSINPAQSGSDPKQTGRLYDDLHARLSAIPGVRGVAHSFPDLLANQPLLTGMYTQRNPASSASHKIWVMRASPEYVSTMGFRLIRGRGIEDRDMLPNASPVSLISETAADRFFPGEDPIGQHWGRAPEFRNDAEIVGVFGDVKYEGLRDPAPPVVLEPFRQDPLGSASFEIRTAGDPAGYMKTVREVVQSVAPNLPIVRMLSQTDIADQGIEQERFFALAFSLFGALALLLASIGLFGVMSYSVASRTNEIGIRMSLGAQKHEVIRMVLSESLWMIAIGVAIGLGAAGAGVGLIRSMLFGLGTSDPATIAIAVLTLTVVAVFAGYLPARRASRIDPMVALRYE